MAHRSHTILVVDDEPDVVKSVQDLLRYDYKVLGATRAREAIKLMQDNEIAVVMSDQRMPEMSGVEFLRRARTDHPDAVRLLITGYADIRAVIDAINEGNVYRYITKPWDPDELQTVIREAIERYDLLVERKRLIGELNRKNAELQKANEALREADGLKTAFIQVASHELRTPVTLLQGLSDLASRVPDVKPPLANWLGQMRRATGRVAHLVDQIVAMLAAGQFDRPLERSRVGLAQLLEDAAEDVQAFVELRRQRLEKDWPADLGEIDLDAGKIRDSLNHLLLNAIKFTPDEGVITLSGHRGEDGSVELTVRDTGVGIDAANLPRMGERFFTGFDVSRHTSGHFEYNRRGLGLGLSIVRSFVEMHGGTMAVTSDPGRGTTVTVRLPAAARGSNSNDQVEPATETADAAPT
jgi:signal transduction histidine kinase